MKDNFSLAKATKRSGGDGVGRGNRQANFSSVQDFATHTSFGGWGANGGGVGGGQQAIERASEGGKVRERDASEKKRLDNNRQSVS